MRQISSREGSKVHDGNRNLRSFSYLDEEITKSPPSKSRILQKSIPLMNGTAVSSSRVKWTWNLNFFFFIKNAMVCVNWESEAAGWI